MKFVPWRRARSCRAVKQESQRRDAARYTCGVEIYGYSNSVLLCCESEDSMRWEAVIGNNFSAVAVDQDCVDQVLVVHFVPVGAQPLLERPLLVPLRPFAHLGLIAQVETIVRCRNPLE